MILEIFSIFDKVAGVFGAPFLSQNSKTAIRQFSYQMSKAEMIAFDCDLYFLGYFNSETGEIKLPDGEKPCYIARYNPEVKKDEQI